MASIQAENLFAFLHQGYPLYCPNCQQNVNMFMVDYRDHLEKHPSTCMYCKTVWKKKVSQWVDAEELTRLKSKPLSASFEELAALQMDVLERQKPVTIEEARAQVLWLHSKSSTGVNDLEIKRHLEMYFPDWTSDKIEDGINKIKTIITRNSDGSIAQQGIVNYLKQLPKK